MFDRLSRSWKLVKASASVLAGDRMLLAFPLASLAALVAVCACFAAPAIGMGALEGLSRRGDIAPGLYALAFLFYFSQYFVIFFFNAALVGAAMMRLDGRSAGLGDGLRIAASRVGAIAGYALVAATVGVVLRVIQERVGFVGRIVVALLGAGWTIATFLVVPVLVARDVGPLDAVKESAALLRKTWGENLIGRVGIAAAFGLVFSVVLFLGAGLVVAAMAAGNVYLVAAAFAVALVAVGIAGLVQAALSGIYEAALYRYATTGGETPGFDKADLQLAFGPK